MKKKRLITFILTVALAVSMACGSFVYAKEEPDPPKARPSASSVLSSLQ